jgi:ADP-ribose pyrophosphatase YjhB (NUDIX family)
MTTGRNANFLKLREKFLPALSVDIVIFGFHKNDLKILLLELNGHEYWGLPGGFVMEDEPLESAAERVLKERTGLSDIFLEQFYSFGDPERTRLRNREKLLEKQLEKDEHAKEVREWFLKRFVTIGFYALVEYTEVNPRQDFLSLKCAWCDINSLPPLITDHGQIIEKALQALRKNIIFQPIGINLLPKAFTMPELQRLYETILGRELDRRNFQKRILGYNIVTRLPQKRTGVAYKAPYLYEFNRETYELALQNGLKNIW